MSNVFSKLAKKSTWNGKKFGENFKKQFKKKQAEISKIEKTGVKSALETVEKSLKTI